MSPLINDHLRKKLLVKLGWSRAGQIIDDITDWPHGLVAGMTYGGKSNLLHFILLQLAQHDNLKLFIIDLKRMEFEAYKKCAWVAYTLPEAIKVLEYLTKEMYSRQEILARSGCVKIQQYYGDMPFCLLVIDEMSQLSPVLSKSKDDKKIRQYAHSLLIDLICIARALGIHVLTATQRPDADILPGQLKANIPASIVFKVRNEINSRICLDNSRAAYLPAIKGRCIYQFQREIEMQIPYVDVNKLSQLLPSKSVIVQPVHKLA